MNEFERPIQPGTYDDLPCWILTASQLTADHLGRMLWGGPANGKLESFEPAGRGRVSIKLAGQDPFTVLASKQLAVERA